ncbi:hypothetical protein HAX54_034043 [Datura stramonium]|uniref:Ribulose bisphosphate carboxylase large chain n=1 Tax=Datura stramonium TaxID=4076 RepID=A0ABS8VEF5_DATST|nr:hypothetical protein [Datura stramonium]
MSCREGFMSPQTETKASVGFKAGVKEYKLTYCLPEYQTKDTDILAAFRVTPHLEFHLKKQGSAVAAESSTDTWTTACGPMDFAVLIVTKGDATASDVMYLGFKSPARSTSGRSANPSPAYVKTFRGPPHGIKLKEIN